MRCVPALSMSALRSLASPADEPSQHKPYHDADGAEPPCGLGGLADHGVVKWVGGKVQRRHRPPAVALCNVRRPQPVDLHFATAYELVGFLRRAVGDGLIVTVETRRTGERRLDIQRLEDRAGTLKRVLVVVAHLIMVYGTHPVLPGNHCFLI